MENASKALIIAGAILLSILIISLGIFIFNQASEITKSSNLSEVEVLQFNEKFTSFEGNNVRGSEVNTLITRILQNNVANQEDKSKQVKLKIEAGETNWNGKNPSESKEYTKGSEVGKAQTGKTYNVSYTTAPKTGLVNEIIIEDSKTNNTTTTK